MRDEREVAVTPSVDVGTASDVVSLVLNPALEQRVPSATRHAVDSMRVEMREGRFTPLPVKK